VYADNGDGTVTDSRTGLMWEKNSDDDSIHDKDNLYDWDEAFARIASLNAMSFAGHTDWRLPNLRELTSIISYGSVLPAVLSAFDTACAPGCTVLTCSCSVYGSIPYWTSTTHVFFTEDAWGVFFRDGEVLNGFKTNPTHVRAVRGGS
jgi:hypothetical protein